MRSREATNTAVGTGGNTENILTLICSNFPASVLLDYFWLERSPHALGFLLVGSTHTLEVCCRAGIEVVLHKRRPYNEYKSPSYQLAAGYARHDTLCSCCKNPPVRIAAKPTLLLSRCCRTDESICGQVQLGNCHWSSQLIICVCFKRSDPRRIENAQ